MNNQLETFTELKDIKFYIRKVKKDNKIYIDTVIVLPNGKDFQLIPNYHIYNKFVLSLYKYNLLKLLK